MRVSHQDIQDAHARIRDGIIRTPCLRSDALSALTGADVFVKMDHLQRTGSFKERGARNALLLLDDDAKRRGVVAASAGNHALGLAHHGRELGIPVTVVMPRTAPLIKRVMCAQLGAHVETSGETFNDAFLRAQELVRRKALVYIHGYDDPAIIAGQGTMGLEILQQVQKVAGRAPDAVVVPIGGAGLIAGVAVAIKHHSPQTRIIGVEPARAATFHAARAAGKPVHLDVGKTIADGLATPDVGANAFETANPLVDELVMAQEEALSIAVLRLIEHEKAVVEGAGAAGFAAMLAGAGHAPVCPGSAPMPDLSGKLVALPLCGGNIDPAMIGRVIERGLAADGRLTRFHTTISDRPGGLAALTAAIASAGASVKDIYHDRAFATSDLSSVDVHCIVETSGPEHVEQVLQALEAQGLDVRVQHGRKDLPRAPGSPVGGG